MISCFRKSKTASLLVLLLTLVIVFLIWLRNQNQPLYIPVIACSLMLGIGICSSRLLGNFIAEQENNRLLAILHMNLEPTEFIEAYKSVPEHTTPGSYQCAVNTAYLADGYSAMGDWEQALRLLSDPVPQNKKGENNRALECLYRNNRCNYLYLMGDTEGADLELKLLKEALAKVKAVNPALVKNMKDSVTFYENWSCYYHGAAVDTAALTKMVSETQFQIRRLELSYLVALTFLRDSRIHDAKQALEQLKKNSGNLYLKTAAENLLYTL